MLKTFLFTSFLAIATGVSAQKVKLIEGALPNLKDEKSINIEFTYNNVSVGKFNKEADYVAAKKEEYNKKEAGTGDSWAIKWVDDREQRFKPKFEELFTKYSGLDLDANAKYTIIFNTSFIEPGFNIGVTRKNAYISGEAIVVETSNKSKVLARISVEKAPGSAMWGADFDTGLRISETYATAGRGLGKFVKK
ncbi:MAG: hypothetical protein KIT80_21110 [Chitinophagaceae bacterium]|nr:hypothetical protein [Chitinophagaceae bacterium]MCW5929434.1 hypothetical protein [Chitinophagaceae bacterium]